MISGIYDETTRKIHLVTPEGVETVIHDVDLEIWTAETYAQEARYAALLNREWSRPCSFEKLIQSMLAKVPREPIRLVSPVPGLEVPEP